MQIREIITKNGKVHYWISDLWNESKETIFFFHGLTANHTMFENQFEFFKDKYNIIAWDAPGHGLSRPFNGFDMQIGVHIIKEIMKTLGLEEFIAVGQSFGGFFPQALLCRGEEAVSAFISIGSTPYGTRYYTKFDYFLLRHMGFMCSLYPFNTLKKASSKAATKTVAGYQNMIEMLKVYTKDEYAALVQLYYTSFMEDNRDFTIKCPVLITHGEFDRVGKVKLYADMWHKATGYEYKTIKNAGHNANVDNPDETNLIIDDFLKRQ